MQAIPTAAALVVLGLAGAARAQNVTANVTVINANQVQFDGWIYGTLSGPGHSGTTNTCQASGYWLRPPKSATGLACEVAPDTADIREHVVGGFRWGTHALVLKSGDAVQTAVPGAHAGKPLVRPGNQKYKYNNKNMLKTKVSSGHTYYTPGLVCSADETSIFQDTGWIATHKTKKTVGNTVFTQTWNRKWRTKCYWVANNDPPGACTKKIYGVMPDSYFAVRPSNYDKSLIDWPKGGLLAKTMVYADPKIIREKCPNACKLCCRVQILYRCPVPTTSTTTATLCPSAVPPRGRACGCADEIKAVAGGRFGVLLHRSFYVPAWRTTCVSRKTRKPYW